MPPIPDRAARDGAAPAAPEPGPVAAGAAATAADAAAPDTVADLPPAAEAAHARRPGEAAFMAVISVASLFLLWSAYGISGFSSLSGSGTMPMIFTLVMSGTAIANLVLTLRKTHGSGETLRRDILPFTVIAMILMIVAYALLLEPLGFLPTSIAFLFLAVLLLSGRGPFFAAWTSVLSVALIYVIFRIIFTVLMPEGIVPEGEIIAWFGHLFGG